MAAAMARGWAGAERRPEAMLFTDLDAARGGDARRGGRRRDATQPRRAGSAAPTWSCSPSSRAPSRTWPRELAASRARIVSRRSPRLRRPRLDRASSRAPDAARDAEPAGRGPPGGALLRLARGERRTTPRGRCSRCSAARHARPARRGPDRRGDGGDVVLARLHRAGRRGARGRGRAGGARRRSSPRELVAEHARRHGGAAARARRRRAIRRAVASPGGATEAGLEALERRAVEMPSTRPSTASLERVRS